jgi:hypothetical protein
LSAVFAVSRFRVLLAVAAAGVACGAAATGAIAGAPRSGCAPSGARVVAASGGSRLYTRGGKLYGCVPGRATKLGVSATTSHLLGGKRIVRYALNGKFAGIDVLANGVDTLNSTVSVVDLGTGKTLHTAPATGPENRAEAFISVASPLVIDAHGTLAWIGSRSAVGAFSPVYELRTLGARGDKLLDSSRKIRPASLVLHGDAISWVDDGLRRAAILTP